MQSNQISPYLHSPPNPSSSPLPSNCQICLATNEEIACILASLFDCLSNLLAKQGKNQSKGENKGEGYGGFSKLVELIFHSKCKNWRDTMSCSHLKCQKYFMKEIGISLQDLDRLSNIKMVHLGKYNFHMDVASLQAKSFHRHFFVQSSRKHIKLEDKKGSQPGSKKSITFQTRTATNKSPTVKQEANQYQQGFDRSINQIYGINQNEMYMYGGVFGEGDGVGGFTQLMKNMFYMGYGFDGTS